ncbi:MAG: ComF family protein [Oscillospiraceae bacterium]|nr:ComF family protein [Oscillospiraceae bacterium]
MFDFSNGGGVRRFLTDLIFPTRCPFCDGFIAYDRLCCEQCMDECRWTDENICPLCGKSVIKGCLCGKRLYDACICAAYYDGNAKKAIMSLKYEHDTQAAEVFGRVLRDMLSVRGFDDIDTAVPVPLHRERLRERGYNQSELIAREIVRGTDIELRTDVLRRKPPRAEQHTLAGSERSDAAKEQYESTGVSLEGKNVLLVDDVLTTGATLNACTALLRAQGAARVICAAAVTVE